MKRITLVIVLVCIQNIYFFAIKTTSVIALISSERGSTDVQSLQSRGIPSKKRDGLRIHKLKRYLNELEKVGFSGSVLVAIDGKKVLSRGYGYRDESQKLRNTPSTVFDIGSVTKQFTGAAITKLESDGKLSFDDKIVKYFPDFPADKSRITINQLLRHSSGLPSGIGGDYEATEKKIFLQKIAKEPLRFESGKRFSYSNVGYSLLAMIVEKISGLSYENYLYKTFWQGAKMESTGYSRPEFKGNVVAIGYEEDKIWGKPNSKPWDTDAPFWQLKGNGGILSTTEDLYTWHLALESDDFLSKESKIKYYNPPLRKDESKSSYYAYGWDIQETKEGNRLIQHNGSNRIFYADYFRYTEDNVVIISLSNKADRNFLGINREISEIIFNPSYKPTIPIANSAENRKFTNKVIQAVLSNGYESGVLVYKQRASDLGLIEGKVNQKGYELISNKKLKAAVDIFKINTFAFPTSSNAFDSLGEAYMLSGEKSLAIKNYQKSLGLDPKNDNACKMIIKLKSK